MKKFDTYFLSAALGAASLFSQQPPLNDAQRITSIYQGNLISQKNQQSKLIVQNFFDMDLTPVLKIVTDGTYISEIYTVKVVEGNYKGLVEQKNYSVSKLSYNLSAFDEVDYQYTKGLNVQLPGFNANVRFRYSQDAVNKIIAKQNWTFTSWTLEGIVNGEEFLVKYKVDNRKTLEGHGHWGKRSITVSYEYEKDSDLFAKRRKTTIGDQTYITEFTSKDGAYLSYVVERKD